MGITRFRKMNGRRFSDNRIVRGLAGGLAAVLFGSVMASSGVALPATAAEGASILISKTVNELKAVRDLRPGDSITYRVEFLANDEDADGPAVVVDTLPAAFAGWEISDLNATFNSQRTGVTLGLPGITSGESPQLPVSGTLPRNIEDLKITVGVALPVQAGAGNSAGTGIPTGAQGVLEYTLTVPIDLDPSDPILRTDLTNTATFTALAGTKPLLTTSSAIIQVDNPVVIDVTPAKSWNPSGQSFQPGATSTLSIGAVQSSNVPASALRLQDPADESLAPNGATALPALNPFNFVDFGGFTSPSDPTTNLPTGAEAAEVEVYRFNGATWNWEAWDNTIPNNEIAGVRMKYTSSNVEIEPGASVSQGFTVSQRATNRASKEGISGGWDATNEVLAAVEVPGEEPVSKRATADFAVAPEKIEVAAQKYFSALPDGVPTTNLTGVTAGDTVGVKLVAINPEAPQSTTLDTLSIVEPGAGSNSEFLGSNLKFAGFDNSDLAAIWPDGATKATITWNHEGGPTVEAVLSGAPLPAAPAGETITGFTIVYEGAIAPNTAAQVDYRIKSSASDTFVAPGATVGPLLNNIQVTGTKAGFSEKNATAGANLSLVAPRIDVKIDKRVGPGIVMPGQDVVVQLDTEVKTDGGRTKPTEIIVEDAWSGPETFWDAFDAKQILPPISRPMTSGEPATQADLKIEYRNADGVWVGTPLATNPTESDPINIPSGTTGLRFVYTNTAGLSQTTYVKPNISFVARDTLRSNPSKRTAAGFDDAKPYENVATAKGTGQLDDRVVTGADDDIEIVKIRGNEGSSGPVIGSGMWAAKTWSDSVLTAQSGATTSTVQDWAATEPGYARVVLQDPAATSVSGAGTAFEAFNLTHIRPIYTSGAARNGTVDSRLQWDLVTEVQLYNGTDWTSVTLAPEESWMTASGFKGYTLSSEEQLNTIGVRLVLEENVVARDAATAAGDLTAPEAGTGVSASADIRSFRLDWELRSTARTADGSPKWVKGYDTKFNCAGDSDGCVDNVFAATGIRADDTSNTATGNDTIQILDGRTNVDLVKQVQSIDAATGLPIGDLADSTSMIVPNPGELGAADYPRARYTLVASNSSTSPDGAKGAMKLAKIRITDTLRPGTDVAMGASQFEGRDYADEVTSPGQHFDTFNLTGVSFGPLPDYIDTAQSQVEVWVFDGTPSGKQQWFTLQQVLAADSSFTSLLPNVIGIATTFSSTDPEKNGNRILVGANLTMHLDVQMRQTSRLTGEALKGGGIISRESVPNQAIARGWDAVVAPETQPTDTDNANVLLKQATINVELRKDVSVIHGATSNDTLLEAHPSDLVSVTLAASSNGSTAPINTLRIEDDSESFWKRFEFTSFGLVTGPKDADTTQLQVKVGKVWMPYADFEKIPGDPSEIVGVAADFSRGEGDKLFPQGSTSWNASWATAVLPFTVQLRPGAEVDWEGDSEENTAHAYAKNVEYGNANDDASDEVLFSAGKNSLQVVKRAPNDTGTHQVDPLVSLPWQLVFTNTGTSYLPIESVTDELPNSLNWDGDAITYVGTPGASGISGLSTDPAEISTVLSEDGQSLVFTWPAGQRMEPGESMTVQLGMVLQPLPTGQQATNSVVVQTGVSLDECLQPTNYGQRPVAPTAENECSNTNFVQPRAGTVVGAVKTVSGEYVDTLDEDLVHGALDVRSGEDCQPGNFRPFGSDYTRNPCASYTAVGATDTWKLQHLNTGSNPLSRMMIVDMMPEIGDKMLAGGAERGSTFKPVLVGKDLASIFRFSGLPAGAIVKIDVTTNPAACVGDTPGSSLWVADPSCSDTATNPANEWTPLESYDGTTADIAGIRVDIDMASAPLQPAGNVILEFETVNRVVDVSDEGLKATLEQYSTPQFAWNQNGVIAWDTFGNRVNLPSAPQRAGVTVKTAPLVVSKVVQGPGADNAPEEFPVLLECTVPSGVADPERVPLDLGGFAELSVPKNGSVTVPGLPIGTNCLATEAGDVGAHGETGRSIDAQPGVLPSTDGLEASVLIRERPGSETLLNLNNTYTLGGFIVEKSVLSADEFPVGSERLTAEYEFELVCQANGMSDPITRSFTLQAGDQHEETDLPEGAQCTLTETGDGDAKSTTMTIAGEETDGESRDGIIISAGGGHALVSNVFDGVPPGKLVNTGAQAAVVIAITIGLLLAGAGALLLARRRSEQAAQ